MTTLIIRLINKDKIYVLLKIEMLLAIQIIDFDKVVGYAMDLCEKFEVDSFDVRSASRQ